MVETVWVIIITLIIVNAILFKKFRTQQKCIKNLVSMVNQIAQESAISHWTSKKNKEDLELIKDALNLHPVEEIA